MQAKTTLDDILERLHATQQELERELDHLLAEKREKFQYRLHRGTVIFEHSIHHWHRQYRTGAWNYLRTSSLAFILSAPVIYGMILPLLILDASVTLYQHICFRIYGIPWVRRADYMVIDRQNLVYLNIIERLNCVYCGYGNGLLEYAREITARTE